MNDEELLIEEASTAVDVTPSAIRRRASSSLDGNERHFRFGGEQEMTSLNEIRRTLERKGFMSVDGETEANRQLERLKKKYNVSVEILDSDVLYRSDAMLERTIRESVYFISAESPKATAEETEHLIRYIQLKAKLMNADRAERTTLKAIETGERIREIENTYKNAHQGASPSLRKIAEILNDKKVESPSGKSDWKATTVKRVIEKAGIDK